MSPAESDPLEELRERVRRTEAAAARLAEQLRADAPGDPFDGFGAQRAHGGDGTRAAAGGEVEQVLAVLADVVRGLVPRELQAQLAELVREFLVALRALVDWCLERLEARRGEELRVEDIPID